MKNYIYIVIFIGLFFSCDYTEIQPKGQTLPTNSQALKDLMHYSYDNYATTTTFYMLDDIQKPDDFELSPPTNPLYNRIYDFEDYFYEEDQTYKTLGDLHSELNRLNIILDNVDISDGTALDKDFLRVTATVKRAHIYYVLISEYCPPYKLDIANNPNTGWCWKFTENYDADLTRSTLQKLYDKIITDLKEVESTNLGRQKYTVYGSKESVQAMLALYYMSMADYDNALIYCDKVLARYNFLYDYNSFDSEDMVAGISNNMEFDHEVILARSGYAKINNSTASNKLAGNHAFMSPDLISYFDKVNDLRWKYVHVDDNGIHRWIGVRSSGDYDYSLTVPLIMLFKAECEARVGTVENALTALNQLRAKRFINTYDATLSTTDKDVAIQYALDEARRELRFTAHRFSYIRRLNTHHNANISITRKSSTGETITLPANSNKWTLPIPRINLVTNPEIEQNPR